MLRGQKMSRMIGLSRDPLSMTMRWQIFSKQAWLSYFKRREWEDTKAYVDTLTYAGFKDWRLPTLEEEMSLMNPHKTKRDSISLHVLAVPNYRCPISYA